MSYMDKAAAMADIAATSAILQKAGLQVSAQEFKPADTSVNAVSVKLPDFWTKEPELLFT
jgi:hypothetical protein